MFSILTMFITGIGASFEFDLKNIIALSTLSNLSLIMSILFIGFPVLSFFHMLTHAFFSALLFLFVGLMIHYISDFQDIRHIGVMVGQLPFMCACFCISNISLCGLPFISGFYSKDIIIEIMFSSGFNYFVFLIFFISLSLTVSYTFRLVYYCLSFNINICGCRGGHGCVVMSVDS